MQIFEITSKKLNEYILQGVKPAPTPAPSKVAFTGLAAPTPTPAATPPAAAATGPFPGTAPLPGTAPTAPTTPIGQQPNISAKDWAGVQGGKLARGAVRGANVLGSIGNALGSQILQKAGLPGDLGMSKSSNPFGDKEAQARQAIQKTNKTLADQLYKNWVSASANTAPNTPAMQQSLDKIITNTLLRGRQPTDFGRYISQEKSQDVAAQLQHLNQAKHALASKNAKMTFQDWMNLVNATSELNLMLAFWPQKFGGVEMRKDGNFYANGAPLNLQKPQDYAIYKNALENNSIRYPENFNINAVDKRAQAAAAPAAATAQAPAGPTVSLGGEELEPGDPVYAALKKQGKI